MSKYKVGDLVYFAEDKYDVCIWGIVTAIEILNPLKDMPFTYYDVLWFDGETSKELESAFDGPHKPPEI
jgi:hypothetical protein